MLEMIDPMQKQAVYTEGKTDFVEGKSRDYNPYKRSSKELSSIWLNGWDQAKKDRSPRHRRLT